MTTAAGTKPLSARPALIAFLIVSTALSGGGWVTALARSAFQTEDQAVRLGILTSAALMLLFIGAAEWFGFTAITKMRDAWEESAVRGLILTALLAGVVGLTWFSTKMTLTVIYHMRVQVVEASQVPMAVLEARRDRAQATLDEFDALTIDRAAPVAVIKETQGWLARHGYYTCLECRQDGVAAGLTLDAYATASLDMRAARDAANDSIADENAKRAQRVKDNLILAALAVLIDAMKVFGVYATEGSDRRGPKMVIRNGKTTVSRNVVPVEETAVVLRDAVPAVAPVKLVEVDVDDEGDILKHARGDHLPKEVQATLPPVPCDADPFRVWQWCREDAKQPSLLPGFWRQVALARVTFKEGDPLFRFSNDKEVQNQRAKAA